MPISDDVFNAQVDRLIAGCEPGSDPSRFIGYVDELGGLYQGLPWVTEVIFRGAVTRGIAHYDRIPTAHQFGELLKQAADEERRLDQRKAQLLPPPTRREVDEIDPTDPYSCTPEERERWAKEDAWIRQWAARISPTPPDILARMSAEDRAYFQDADKGNASVANWPNLKPAERRAKERRIELARREAMRSIARTLDKPEPQFEELPEIHGIPTRPRPEPALVGAGVWPSS